MNSIGGMRIKKTAEISECGKFRWWLQRRWCEGPIVSFIMLNPSTADANIDDATVRKCIGFAWRWGFAALSIRNVYPYRATNPDDLWKAMLSIDVTGGERGLNELRAAKTADLVVAAWGTRPNADRLRIVMKETESAPLYCVGTSIGGMPSHPLYQQYTSKPLAYKRCEGHFWSDVLGEIVKCEKCKKESPKHFWIKGCPCCGGLEST